MRLHESQKLSARIADRKIRKAERLIEEALRTLQDAQDHLANSGHGDAVMYQVGRTLTAVLKADVEIKRT